MKWMQMPLVVVALILGLASGVVRAQTTRTYDGLWDGIPESGDHIVIESGVLTWDTSLPDTVGNWTQNGGAVTFDTRFPGQGDFQLFTIGGNAVLNGGSWTHGNNATYGSGNTNRFRLNVEVEGSLSVGDTAAIVADGLGYAVGQGPGKGIHAREGGSYGGIGGTYFQHVNRSSGMIYGSITAPVDLGSGGSIVNGSGTGGGAIRLNVNNTLTLDGEISAQGAAQGGAGGSILIQAGEVYGTGTVTVHGGRGDNNNWPGGGGGRIAMILTTEDADFDDFTGDLIAYGGDQSHTWRFHGAAGTVYLETEAQASGQGLLIIDNGGYGQCAPGVFTLMPPGTDLSAFAEVIIRGQGNLAIDAFSTLNFGTATISGSGRANAIVTIAEDDGVTFPDPFTLAGYTLRADGLSSVTGDWIISDTGRLSHTPNNSDANAAVVAYAIDLTINGGLTIATGGEINVNACGFMQGYGPGVPTTHREGGAHGGLGGQHEAPNISGTTYGSIVAPAHLGSASNDGGVGGGRVRLTVTETLALDGAISANGGSRGSGGSVWLSVGRLIGDGAIAANGVGHANFGGGGGGRVALYLTDPASVFDDFDGTLTAYGGDSGNIRSGAAGTVFMQSESGSVLLIENFAGSVVADGVATLINDASGLEAAAVHAGVSNTRLTLGVDASFGDLTLDSGTTLDLNGHSLYVDVPEKPLDGTVVLNGGELIWWTPPVGTLFRLR